MDLGGVNVSGRLGCSAVQLSLAVQLSSKEVCLIQRQYPRIMGRKRKTVLNMGWWALLMIPSSTKTKLTHPTTISD